MVNFISLNAYPIFRSLKVVKECMPAFKVLVLNRELNSGLIRLKGLHAYLNMPSIRQLSLSLQKITQNCT